MKFGLCDVAICERDSARLSETARDFSIDETYMSLDAALENHFDGAVICTPNFAHEKDMKKCMDAGLNVMLEKPLSSNYESSKSMVEYAHKKGRWAFVAYCLRFAPAYRIIRDYIQSGRLGKVFGIRASVAGKKAITDAKTDYRTKKDLGGGVISDFSHEIDYSLWFTGKRVTAVNAVSGRVVHKNWEVDDSAELLLTCEDDIYVSIHMDFLQPYFGRSIEVYGTGGAIRWRDNEPIKFFEENTGSWQDIDSGIDWEKVYRDEMLHYIDCLQKGSRLMVDEVWACEIMRIVNEAHG
jgi:predicted dehydrogenase